MLVGWGPFNLVEGIVDLLTLHHVREDVAQQWAYDLGFLVLGALLVIGGWALARLGEERSLLRPRRCPRIRARASRQAS